MSGEEGECSIMNKAYQISWIECNISEQNYLIIFPVYSFFAQIYREPTVGDLESIETNETRSCSSLLGRQIHAVAGWWNRWNAYSDVRQGAATNGRERDEEWRPKRDSNQFSRRDGLGEFDEHNRIEPTQFIGDFLREWLVRFCGVVYEKHVVTRVAVRFY